MEVRLRRVRAEIEIGERFAADFNVNATVGLSQHHFSPSGAAASGDAKSNSGQDGTEHRAYSLAFLRLTFWAGI